MLEYYLAVDIGASSGRHILGSMEDGKLSLVEIHRFENSIRKKNGHLCWDLEALFNEIKIGLKKCKECGKIPVSMGIDTWAVDHVLLDRDNQVLGNTYAYRDHRTNGMDALVYEAVSGEELYQRTGIAKQIFNTIFQLMALKEQEPQIMEQAENMLLLPDYFHFLLTGVKKTEYTNASTTQLVNAKTKDWDMEVIERLGFKKGIFGPISKPGSFVGNFSKEIAEEVGFSCKVILPATHDTASAVMAIPSVEENNLYISSGTWSLMGTELLKENTSKKSEEANLTNEGGYDYRFRFLKNIMGLWMIQSVKKELEEKISFAELCNRAEKETISTIVNCNDDRFLSPENMTQEIQAYCRENHLAVPETAGQIAAVIYNSLAECYRNTIKEIEDITGFDYKKIYIVGGGANADYLNKLVAKYTGKTVYAGPGEATAIGNIMAQLLEGKKFENLVDSRKNIYESFEIAVYN